MNPSIFEIADKHKMPAIYIFRLMEVANESGFDSDWMFAKMGLEFNAFQAKDAQCTAGHRLRLLNAIRETHAIPGLGLMVGRRIMVSDHGIVGYAILSSANLRRVMDIISRFHQLSNPTVRPSYHIDGDDVVINESPIFPFDDFATRYHLEEMLAAWVPIGTLLQRGSFQFREVRVPWGKPDYHHLYEQLFRCPIKYNQIDCGSRFPKSLLGERIPLANPEVALLCEHQCDLIAHEQYGEHEVAYQVQRLLLAQPGHFPTIDQVARKLNLSARSLRRHLRAERKSFRSIVEDLRMNIAAKYLRSTQIPSQSIATLLGYSAPANFHRAFKRCTGVTPQQFRRLG